MGRAKRLRIAELERQRLERLASGRGRAERTQKTKGTSPTQIRCGKCGIVYPETIANAHFSECQPHGLRCGRCQRWVVGPDFVGHMRECLTQPAVEPAEVLFAGHGALKDPALLAAIRMQTRRGVRVLSIEPKEETKPVDIPENK